ncbi:MAG: phosphoribosyltransferase [Cyclobacteriaceae bacterium]
MRVIYLIGAKFDEACQNLAKMTHLSYQPDLVIGVLTGGGVVGREFLKSWPENKPDYIEMEIKRDLTKKKEKFNVSKLLRRLPRFLTEFLIIAEVKYLESRSKKGLTPRVIPEAHKQVLIEKIKESEIKKILIIDDCIDTGGTIKSLQEYLKNFDQIIDVQVATITITHTNPIVVPDYTLYNRVICRFPWSMEISTAE